VRLRSLVLSMSLLAVPALAAEEPPEALLGVSTDLAAGQVVFEVASNGCTAKADFRGRLEGAVLTLVRIRRDACKAMPRREPIAFSLAELGLKAHQPFTLGNRLVVSEASAR
jgi:hypothetical protein